MTFLTKLGLFLVVLPFTILVYFLVIGFLVVIATLLVVFAPTKVWYAVSKFIDRSSGK